MNIEQLGLNNSLREYCREHYPGAIPGRIIGEGKHIYRAASEAGEFLCRVSGAFRYSSTKKADFPVTGDWVALGGGGVTIEALLPRKNSISRKSAGEKTEEQILAANVDLVCIVAGLDGGRNFTRHGVERYLALASESGADAALVLNKLDLCTDLAVILTEAEEAAAGIPILLTSTVTGDGMKELNKLCGPGVTAVFAGPSGVGKSSLINSLAGDGMLEVGELRSNDLRGRHTSTSITMVALDSGGCLIDTPGLRELQLWGGEESLQAVFSEIESLAEACRFRDCTHTGEPGCAVLEALNEGSIESSRYEAYLDLRKELMYLRRRTDEQARKDDLQKWKQISRSIKDLYKHRGHK